MGQTFALPQRWSPETQNELATFLAARADAPVTVSAAALTRVDCMMLQYVLAAARAWHRRGLAFNLADQPAGVAESLALLGVGPDHLAGRA